MPCFCTAVPSFGWAGCRWACLRKSIHQNTAFICKVLVSALAVIVSSNQLFLFHGEEKSCRRCLFVARSETLTCLSSMGPERWNFQAVCLWCCCCLVFYPSFLYLSEIYTVSPLFKFPFKEWGDWINFCIWLYPYNVILLKY